MEGHKILQNVQHRHFEVNCPLEKSAIYAMIYRGATKNESQKTTITLVAASTTKLYFAKGHGLKCLIYNGVPDLKIKDNVGLNTIRGMR